MIAQHEIAVSDSKYINTRPCQRTIPVLYLWIKDEQGWSFPVRFPESYDLPPTTLSHFATDYVYGPSRVDTLHPCI